MSLGMAACFASFAAASHADGFPELSQHVADCEGKWALTESQASSFLREVGFVYVDRTMGFTIESRGQVALSPERELVRKPSQLEGKAVLLVRVAENFPAACLSAEQRDRLGLPEQWELSDNYRDKRPLGEHYASWASHYNHIGANEQALEFAKLARAEHYSSASLEFEHGFALNALERYDDALEVLVAGARLYPHDSDIAAETGYAHLSRGDYQQAIDFYRHALDYDKKHTSSLWGEYARNIALAYGKLEDRKHAEEWARKAAAWEQQQKEKESAD